MKLLYSLLIALLLAPAAHAEERLGQAALDLLGSLRKQGIEQVGALNIRSLEAQAASIQWDYNHSKEMPSFAGDRKSAYFRYAPNSVSVSDNLPAFAADFYPSLELHETLGTLHYRDKNYALSMALRLLAETKNLKFRKDLQKSFSKTLFAGANLREGGSSVGSGGDLVALSAKSLLLDEILAEESQVTFDFLEFYPKIHFEPDYDTNKKHIDVEYRVESKIRNDGRPKQDYYLMTDSRIYYEETITIFVPVKQWSKSLSARNKIISETKDLIVSVFPASPNYATETVTVTGCDSTLKVKFPANSSSAARLLQRERLGLRPDCKSTFGFGNKVSFRLSLIYPKD